jgi:hypothetical protein
MKKFKLTMLSVILLMAVSCKKESAEVAASDSNVKISNKAMVLPGQGQVSTNMFSNGNGTYSAAWYGSMTFGTMVLENTFYEGQPVQEASIINNGEYASVDITGPKFIAVRPTLAGGAPTPNSLKDVRDLIDRFKNEYRNFVEAKRNSSGVLIQPKMPLMNAIVTDADGDGLLIIKGQVIRSKNSPSTLQVTHPDFVATQPGFTPVYLDDVVKNGIQYSIFGNQKTGQITSVTGYSISTGTPITVYGFSGTFPSTLASVNNLIIYTSPTSSFTYSGPIPVTLN